MRVRILHLYDQGRSKGEIAASLGHCLAALRRLRRQLPNPGTAAPQMRRCGRKKLSPARRWERLQALIARQPDATPVEPDAQFKRPTSTLDLWLTQLGMR